MSAEAKANDLNHLEVSIPESEQLDDRSSQVSAKRRSCFSCRRRKVKCNRESPCESCVRTKTDCVFPSKAATPTTNQTELRSTLQKLTEVFQNIGSSTSYEQQKPKEGFGEKVRDSRSDVQLHEVTASSPSEVQQDLHAATDHSSKDSEIGRLIQDQGSQRYINDINWAIADIEVNSHPTLETDNLATAQVDQSSEALYRTIFGDAPSSSSSFSQLLVLFPAQYHSQAWTLYKSNVEPCTKVFHPQRLEYLVMPRIQTGWHPEASPSKVACLACFYAAVTSLTDHESRRMFSQSRQSLCEVLKVHTLETFSLCDLLHTDNLLVLQSLVLFLVCLRNHDLDLMWKLLSIATRLAQRLGMHRGIDFALPTYEREIRARLWWSIMMLDATASEDCSIDYTLLETNSFDVSMPSDMSDAALDASDSHHAGATDHQSTDMTIFLVRCELLMILRTLIDPRRMTRVYQRPMQSVSVQEQDAWLTAVESALFRQYLRRYLPSTSIQWVASLLIRITISKLRFQIQRPLQAYHVLDPERRKRMFLLAIDIIEMAYILRTNPETRHWAWCFSSMNQWNALVFVLLHLHRQPLCEGATQAWRAVERFCVLRWDPVVSGANRSGHQWQRIEVLIDHARARRYLGSRIEPVQSSSSRVPVQPPDKPGEDTSGDRQLRFFTPVQQAAGTTSPRRDIVLDPVARAPISSDSASNQLQEVVLQNNELDEVFSEILEF